MPFALEPFFASFSDLFTGDAPIIRIDLLDDYKGGGRVFSQNVRQQPGRAGDKLLFLFLGNLFPCDLDIDIWHVDSSFEAQVIAITSII